MNKKVLSIIATVLLVTIITGCATTNKIFGKNAVAEVNSKNKVENVQKSLNQNAAIKMDQVAILASGTDYALNKVTNQEPSVVVAKDINTRVISLSGKPNLNAEKEMWKTVDQLLSEISAEKAKGVKSMTQRDAEITSLQEETKVLITAKDAEIGKYMKLASNTAMKADALKATLDEMDSWLGLGAVFYGVKKFILSSMWILGIGSILFLILRFASMSNPIAASIFSIFNRMGSWVVNTLAVIFPKALEMAGHTATSMFDAYKKTMVKMIDTIQTLKDRQRASADPTKKITVDELMDEMAKSMGDKDKELVTKIKQEIGYK
jgi:hypothetical protein